MHNDNECAEVVVSTAARFGSAVTASTAPHLNGHPFPTEEFTCPHGVAYYVDPTPEQAAAWLAEGAH